MLKSRFPSKEALAQNSQCTVHESPLILPAAVCVIEEDKVVIEKGIEEALQRFSSLLRATGFCPVAAASVSTNVVQVSPENKPPEAVLQTIYNNNKTIFLKKLLFISEFLGESKV